MGGVKGRSQDWRVESWHVKILQFRRGIAFESVFWSHWVLLGKQLLVVHKCRGFGDLKMLRAIRSRQRYHMR